MTRQLWWTASILVWLASAIYSWMILTAVAMFNGLASTPLSAWVFCLAPGIALAVLAVAALARRRAAWLPATLLVSPALQLIGLLWAQLDQMT